MRSRLDRRTFLRGLGGIAIALPTLEVMLNSNGTAYADETPVPYRFGIFYAGASLGGNDDATFSTFADGSVEYAPFRTIGVQGDVTIVNGLHIPAAERNASFHIDAMPVIATGVRGNGHVPVVPTADQKALAHLGAGALFPILHTQTQAEWYLNDGSAPYGRDVISYAKDANGVMRGQASTISPKAAFRALFQNFVPPDPEEAKRLSAGLARRKSILDVVRKSYERVSTKVSAADRIRIAEHLSRIRDLEVRVNALVTPATPTCKLPTNPGEDPTIGAARGVDDVIAGNEAYSNEEERAKVHMELIAMALTCRLTHVVSHVFTMAQSHLNMYPLIGERHDMHECGHSAKTPAVQKVLSWHTKHFGTLVKTLRETQEGSGKLLDRCALVLMTEGGSGYDPEGNRQRNPHSTENMSMVVAGRAGGMKMGSRIAAGTGTSPTDARPVHVLNTMLKAVGVPDADAFVSDQKKGFITGLI